jgi:hypothetical protein
MRPNDRTRGPRLECAGVFSGARSGCLALYAVLVLISTADRAFAGASIVEPAPPRTPGGPTGLNFGFWASSSQPSGDSRGVLDRSFKAGGALTWMRSRTIGVGLGVDHCRWRSPAAGAALDDFFSAFSGTEIRGTEVTMSSIRGTVRGTQWLFPDALVSPWVQFGAGVCRLDRKIVFPVEQLRYSGWQLSNSGTKNISYQPILVGGLGFDLRPTGSTRVGFDVMGEIIYLSDEPDPVTAITLGGHVLFGRWP